jgi:hypothetical protein
LLQRIRPRGERHPQLPLSQKRVAAKSKSLAASNIALIGSTHWTAMSA